jgi:peptidoglycan/xylan/chitin deacetylase (PgdA/CDA1 family)
MQLSLPRGLAVAVVLALVLSSSGTSARKHRARQAPPLVTIRGHEMPGYVAFTFDDGPEWRTTPRILDTLDEAGLKSTFFVCGRRFAKRKNDESYKNGEVLRDMIRRGHRIGNHTFHHVDLSALSPTLGLQEIDRNERAILAFLDTVQDGRVRLFRPPYGRLSPSAATHLAREGYTMVKWSVDPRDWENRSAEHVRRLVMDRIRSQDGGIVVLHDTRSTTADAFPRILEDLEQENCQRLRAGKAPLLPVDLDYFVKDASGLPLPVSKEVEARTEATRARLSARCSEIDKERGND